MPYAAQRDLRGKHPTDTFARLVTIDNTGSLFDGTGSQIVNIDVSCSYASSASYEIVYETSSSYADYAVIADTSVTSSWASASISSSHSVSGSAALYSVSSSHSDYSTSGSAALYSVSSSYAGYAVLSDSASKINFVTTASNLDYFVPFVQSVGSQQCYIDTASVKYNPSTKHLIVDNISASAVTASLDGTASWAVASINSNSASLATKADKWLKNIDIHTYYAIDANDTQGGRLVYVYNDGGNVVSLWSATTNSIDIGISGLPTVVQGPLTASEGISGTLIGTSSWASTASFISPSFGVVSNMTNATGSAAGAPGSFTDAAELGAFILAVSTSFQTINTLIADLKSVGIIT